MNNSELWNKYPENKPTKDGTCIVILYFQNDLGLSKYTWCVDWNEDQQRFRDFAGCNDIKKGAQVKYFMEEPNYPQED